MKQRKVIRSAVVEFLLVLAFVLIGRKNHGHSETLRGVFSTFWPFLIGLIVGWLVSKSSKNAPRVFMSGIVVWIVTVVVGQLLRVVAGQGTTFTFVVVSFAFLGLAIVGSRIVLRFVDRRM